MTDASVSATISTVTAVKSMTGYAQAQSEHEGWALRVSVRSVNHRFLDLRLHLPDGLDSCEPQIRQRVRERVRRGHVDVTLHVDSAKAAGVRVNREVAESYLRALEDLRRDFEFGPGHAPDLVALLRLPGVVDVAGAANSETGEDQLNSWVQGCLDLALDRLDDMRSAEGRALAEEMFRLTAAITATTKEVTAVVERSLPAYAAHLKSRLEELLGGAPIEPARLAQEAAMLAERADVSEELARLRSHVEQFEKLLSTGGEIGKRLDFLLQEMQREANTLLSKTPGLGAEGLAITGLGLDLKAEIEKLREQAQNVE